MYRCFICVFAIKSTMLRRYKYHCGAQIAHLFTGCPSEQGWHFKSLVMICVAPPMSMRAPWCQKFHGSQCYKKIPIVKKTTAKQMGAMDPTILCRTTYSSAVAIQTRFDILETQSTRLLACRCTCRFGSLWIGGGFLLACGLWFPDFDFRHLWRATACRPSNNSAWLPRCESGSSTMFPWTKMVLENMYTYI